MNGAWRGDGSGAPCRAFRCRDASKMENGAPNPISSFAESTELYAQHLNQIADD